MTILLEGQNLSVSTPHIVAGTKDYLSVEIIRGNGWSGLHLHVFFKQGATTYELLTDGNRIGPEAHINLTEGKWSVSVSGYEYDGDQLVMKITSNSIGLNVAAAPPESGSDLPYVPASSIEQIAAIAQSVRDDADAGLFNGEKGDKGDKGDPGDPPTDAQILSAVDEWFAENPTEVKNDIIADQYSSSGTYDVGDYVWHSGYLYKCTTAITAAEEWTAAHWTAAVLGDDVSNLKSAISFLSTNTDDALSMSESFQMKPVYEIGTINSSGNNQSSTIRLRTVDKIPLGKYSKIVFTPASGWKFEPELYKKDGTFQSAGMKTSEFVLKKSDYPTVESIRWIMGKTTNADVSLSESSNLTVTCYTELMENDAKIKTAFETIPNPAVPLKYLLCGEYSNSNGTVTYDYKYTQIKVPSSASGAIRDFTYAGKFTSATTPPAECMTVPMKGKYIIRFRMYDGTFSRSASGNIIRFCVKSNTNEYLYYVTGTSVTRGQEIYIETDEIADGYYCIQLRIDGAVTYSTDCVFEIVVGLFDDGSSLRNELADLQDDVDELSSGLNTVEADTLENAQKIGNLETAVETINTHIDEQIPEVVTDWLDENVPHGQTLVVDKSLSVEGTAADAAQVGKLLGSASITLTNNIIHLSEDIVSHVKSVSATSGAKYVGENIFNKNTKVAGKIINNSGTETVDGTSHYYSQMIPVKGRQITANFAIQRLYLYNSAGEFIERTSSYSSGTPIMLATDVYFVRVQIANTTENETMAIAYGKSPIAYRPYKEENSISSFVEAVNVFLDGINNVSITINLAGVKGIVPDVKTYAPWEPATVTDDYKCTPLGTYNQTISALTDTLKYIGFLATYFDVYLGVHSDGYTVTREDLGLDSGAEASGHIASPIYSYTFSPKYYNKTVLLSAGMNTNEASTYFGLAYFIKALMEHTDDGMLALYNSTRFIVIPVICPSGIAHSPLLYPNSNGVRINKNFEYHGSWSNLYVADTSGAYPDSEVETKALKYWLNKYAGSDFWLDCHADTADQSITLHLATLICSDDSTKNMLEAEKESIISYYRAKGYYGESDNPTLSVTKTTWNAAFPKTVYGKEVTRIPSVMMEQFEYSTAWGSDGDTNNDSYAIKEFVTMIRYMVLIMCRDDAKAIL